MGIGEQAWLGEIDENAFHNIDDPNSERRDKVFLPSAVHTELSTHLCCFSPILYHQFVVAEMLKSCSVTIRLGWKDLYKDS